MNDLLNPVRTRLDIADFIAYIQITQKYHYNRYHKIIAFEPGDWVYLKLYKGYKIPVTAITDRKLSNQRVRPLKVIKRIKRLTYRLLLPDHWRIYNIITVAQLKPATPSNTDPYKKKRPTEPPALDIENAQYEVNRLLNKRLYRKKTIQYLVR